MASWQDDAAEVEDEQRQQDTMVHDIHIDDEEADNGDHADGAEQAEDKAVGKGKEKMVDKKE